MRAAFSLIWKEWRELRWFLYIGLAVFLFIPAVEMLRSWLLRGRIESFMIEFIVLALSGLLAIIVGVGATCRDLDPRLRAFWQASPIGLSRWLISKYVVGLAVVLLVCIIPLGLKIGLEVRERGLFFLEHRVACFALAVLGYYTFTVVLLFSIAFMSGCLVRRAAHAGILCVGLALLIHFLPIVFPPLRSLGAYNLVFGSVGTKISVGAHWRFVLAMLAGSVLALVLGWIAVRRDWQLEVGKRLICWSLGVVVLMLASGAALQLGANRTCIQQFAIAPPNLPKGQARVVVEFVSSGQSGLLVLRDARHRSMFEPDTQRTVCHFELSKSGPVLGNEVAVDNAAPATKDSLSNLSQASPQIVWLEAHPNRVYHLRTHIEGEIAKLKRPELTLLTVALDRPPERAIIHQLDLLRFLPGTDERNLRVPMCEYKGRIYVQRLHSQPSECRIAVVDLSEPDAPRVAEVLGDQPEPRFLILDPETEAKVPGPVPTRLLRIPGLSERDQLELTVRLALDLAWLPMDFSGDLAVGITPEGLATRQVARIEGIYAYFRECGWRRATPLEKTTGVSNVLSGRVRLRNGLAYNVDPDGLTVYDVRRPEAPRRISHYRASGQQFSDVLPLPDGRILLGGSKLHLLAPPKLD